MENEDIHSVSYICIFMFLARHVDKADATAEALDLIGLANVLLARLVALHNVAGHNGNSTDITVQVLQRDQ